MVAKSGRWTVSWMGATGSSGGSTPHRYPFVDLITPLGAPLAHQARVMGRAGNLELVCDAPRAVEDGEGAAGQRGGDDRSRAGLDVVRAVGHAGRAPHAPVGEIVHPHA